MAKKKGLLQRLRRSSSEEEGKIVPRHKVFVDLGVSEHAVEVIVHEIPKSNWGIGGVPASEKFKDNS
jgi:hypothetical protein